MKTRRRTTVHDLAALRVHPDGTRVQNSEGNRTARRSKYAVRDTRGNWIAHDAGGLGTVKLRRTASRPGEDERVSDDAEGPVDSAEEVEAPGPSWKDKGKGRAQDDSEEEVEAALDSRTVKRRRFNDDLSFLSPRDSSAHTDPAPEEQVLDDGHKTLPVPSGDLLKCLHYFASSYYTAMDQLYDASREARKERKIRRTEKLKKAESASSSRATSQARLSDTDEDDNREENEDESEGGSSEKKGGRKRGRYKRLGPMDKDMYKMFDGSALMALGMLFQEHIAEVLDPHIPVGWEKEMVAAERIRKAEGVLLRKTRERQNRRANATSKSETANVSEEEESGSGKEGSEGSGSDAEMVEGRSESPKQESRPASEFESTSEEDD